MPEQNLLGELNEGFKLIMANFQWERLAMALGAVGAMTIAWERTAEFARERQRLRPPAVGPSGDPPQARRSGHVGVHLPLRHLRRAAPLRRRRGAAARRSRWPSCSRSARRFELMDECLQIHGGAGYMREYWVERAARDARLGPIGGGSDEIMREILGRALALASVRHGVGRARGRGVPRAAY